VSFALIATLPFQSSALSKKPWNGWNGWNETQ